MTIIKRNRSFHVKRFHFQLFSASGCTEQFNKSIEGGNVANTEASPMWDNSAISFSRKERFGLGKKEQCAFSSKS